MSRIIVKNLPKNISEERLRNIFELLGPITDCSLKYTKDGVFRQFAFIGYKTEKEAAGAVLHFHKTFIDTSRIQVELAKDLGDTSKPRAWSKYAQDSSSFRKKLAEREKKVHQEKVKQGKVNKSDEVIGELKENADFQEFMAAHKSGSSKTLWSNDTSVNDQAVELSSSSEVHRKGRKHSSQIKSSTGGSDEEEATKKLDIPGDTSKTAYKAVSDLEYLMSKVTKSNLLSDDDDSDASDTELNTKGSCKETKNLDDESQKEIVPEEEDYRFNYIVKMKGLPLSVKKLQIVNFFKPIKTKDIKLPHSIKGRKKSGIASVTFFTEKDMEDAMRRNKNFIGQKKIFLHKAKEMIKEVIHEQPKPWEIKKAEEHEEIEGIEESGRLFIRNLAYCCKEEEIEELFAKYGPLTEVNLPLDSFTKKIKGFAFITYMMPEHAVKAYTELDGKVFQGRMLHILPAKLKQDSGDDVAESLSYKKKKDLQRKKDASNSCNWNTLFLGANAVADVMAEKYSTSKSQILSADSRQSLGVRLALGETQVVAETRDFLLEHGVALDAFSQPTADRSKTVILVKNLPASTKGEELQEIFSRFGTLGRVVLPPSGVTGIVEFADISEARNAFNNLAYTKFRYVPLYLEWAPVGVFSSPMAKKSDNNSDEAKNDNEAASKCDEDNMQNVETLDSRDDTENDRTEPGSSLFIKNLNFETTEDTLMKHFQKCGKIQTVSIARKKDMKHPGQLLSMGYGFVEFVKKESAEKALKRLQHSMVDGHQIEVKVSHRATKQRKAPAVKKQDLNKKQMSTKILVRNIPFEAKTEEIKELFSTFGELKFVRLPKKLTGSGSHRGFAFVDFVTKNDAKRAFNALCHSTHLYGRRLVLEWAETEDSIDQLRNKTAEHYHHEPAQKRLKKSMLMDELNAATKFDD